MAGGAPWHVTLRSRTKQKGVLSLFRNSKGVLIVACKHFILSEFHFHPYSLQMSTTKMLKYIFTLCFPNALYEKSQS